MKNILDEEIYELNIGVRAYHFLSKHDITIVEDLVLQKEEDIKKIRGLNDNIIKRIKNRLSDYNLHLGMD